MIMNDEPRWWIVWYRGNQILPCPVICPGDKNGAFLEDKHDNCILGQERIKDWNSELIISDIIHDHPFGTFSHDRFTEPQGSKGQASSS